MAGCYGWIGPALSSSSPFGACDPIAATYSGLAVFRSVVVAGAGFEPADLRVMSPAALTSGLRPQKRRSPGFWPGLRRQLLTVAEMVGLRVQLVKLNLVLGLHFLGRSNGKVEHLHHLVTNLGIGCAYVFARKPGDLIEYINKILQKVPDIGISQSGRSELVIGCH